MSCISGEGIAVEIKEILSKYVDEEKIDIITMDYSELKKAVESGEYRRFS